MLFRKTEKRNSTYTLQDASMAEWLGISTDISSDKAKSATVFACLRILSDSVSKLGVKLYKEGNDGVEKASGHYLYNLVKLKPNQYMTASTFWKTVEFQRSYHGISIVPISTEKRTGKVTSLTPIDMSKVTIVIDDKGIIDQNNAIWYVYRHNGKERKFRHDQVLVFMGMTRDGITPMSVLDYLGTVVENEMYGQSYQNKFFKSGLSAKAFVTYTGDLSPENEIKLRNRIEKMASGIDNSGRVAVLPFGFDLKTINASMADAQFSQLQQLSITQIANAFGIKSFQLNNLERSTHSNIEHQQREFYVETLMSIINQYEMELTSKLLTEKDQNEGLYFRFNTDSILRSDSKTRAEFYGLMIEKGIMTPNECREKENLPKYAGGDKLIVNGNFIPIDMVGQQYTNDTPLKGGVTE